MWRFATSTRQIPYIPPFNEAWETEIKISSDESDKTEVEEDKYASRLSMAEFGEYKPKSEYATKLEYSRKSEYK